MRANVSRGNGVHKAVGNELLAVTSTVKFALRRAASAAMPPIRIQASLSVIRERASMAGRDAGIGSTLLHQQEPVRVRAADAT